MCNLQLSLSNVNEFTRLLVKRIDNTIAQIRAPAKMDNAYLHIFFVKCSILKMRCTLFFSDSVIKDVDTHGRIHMCRDRVMCSGDAHRE